MRQQPGQPVKAGAVWLKTLSRVLQAEHSDRELHLTVSTEAMDNGISLKGKTLPGYIYQTTSETAHKGKNTRTLTETDNKHTHIIPLTKV